MKRTVLSQLLRFNCYQRRVVKRGLLPYQYVGVMHLIVHYVGRNPGASQEEIACFYGLDKTSVARDARRLEDLGHIERRISRENRRQYQIFLTDPGRGMIQVIEEELEKFQKELSAGFEPEEWEQLTVLLERLVENAYACQI